MSQIGSAPGLLSRLRAGHDSIANFEAAAEQRYQEGKELHRQGRHYAAIYLYGYAIEMWLKAAYFHNEAQLHPRGNLTRADLDRAWKNKQLAGVVGRVDLHDISGWARLLTYIRTSKQILAPFTPRVRRQIENVADAARSHWDPQLRYRHLPVVPAEVMTVFRAAAWFRTRYNGL